MRKYYIIDGINGNILSGVIDSQTGEKALELFMLNKAMVTSDYVIVPGDCKYHTLAINKYTNDCILQAIEY